MCTLMWGDLLNITVRSSNLFGLAQVIGGLEHSGRRQVRVVVLVESLVWCGMVERSLANKATVSIFFGHGLGKSGRSW